MKEERRPDMTTGGNISSLIASNGRCTARIGHERRDVPPRRNDDAAMMLRAMQLAVLCTSGAISLVPGCFCVRVAKLEYHAAGVSSLPSLPFARRSLSARMLIASADEIAGSIFDRKLSVNTALLHSDAILRIS